MSILVETERGRKSEQVSQGVFLLASACFWKGRGGEGRGGDWGWPAGEMNESRGARNAAREIET